MLRFIQAVILTIVFCLIAIPVQAQTFKGIEYVGNGKQEFYSVVQSVYAHTFGSIPLTTIFNDNERSSRSKFESTFKNEFSGIEGVNIQFGNNGYFGLRNMYIIAPTAAFEFNMSLVECSNRDGYCGYGAPIYYAWADEGQQMGELESFHLWPEYTRLANLMISANKNGYDFIKYTADDVNKIYFIIVKLHYNDRNPETDYQLALFVLREEALQSPPFENVNFEIVETSDQIF